MERRATYDAMMAATTAHRVFLVEDALAVGVAAGKVESDLPWLILQIGAGAAFISVFEQGAAPHKRQMPLAGNHFDLLIRRRIWDELGRVVDLETSRALKHAVAEAGSTSRGAAARSAILKDEWGAALDEDQVAPLVTAAVEAGLMELVGEIQWFLRELPEKVLHGLDRSKVILAGGSARWPGIATWLADRLGRDVDLMDQPEQVVIKGLQTIATEFETRGWFRKLAGERYKR